MIERSSLQNELADVHRQLDSASEKLVVLKTPPQGRRRSHVEVELVGDADANSPNKNQCVESSAFAPSSAAPSAAGVAAAVATAQQAALPPRQLSYTNQAKIVTESKGTKGITVAQVLQELHRGRHLSGAAWNVSVTPPSHYKEKKSVTYVLELVEFVISDEERVVFQSPCDKVTDEQLEQTSRNVQQMCMDKMLEFEGEDLELYKKLLKNEKKAPKAATYHALGCQIRSYKKELRQLLCLNPSDDPPLQNRPRAVCILSFLCILCRLCSLCHLCSLCSLCFLCHFV